MSWGDSSIELMEASLAGVSPVAGHGPQGSAPESPKAPPSPAKMPAPAPKAEGARPGAAVRVAAGESACPTVAALSGLLRGAVGEVTAVRLAEGTGEEVVDADDRVLIRGPY